MGLQGGDGQKARHDGSSGRTQKSDGKIERLQRLAFVV
jgi:hypothetical protein